MNAPINAERTEATEPCEALCQHCGKSFQPGSSRAHYHYFFCSGDCERKFAVPIVLRWGIDIMIRQAKGIGE